MSKQTRLAKFSNEPNTRISTAQAYTTVAPANAHTGSAATIDAALPVNFSGRSISGASSAFTVGGWVRFLQLPADNKTFVLFEAAEQFSLIIDHSGLVIAYFGDNADGARVVASTAVVDNEWHYVAAAAGIDAESGQFRAKIVLDGIKIGQSNIVSSSSTSQGACTIGTGYTEFVAWTIWPSALSTKQLNVPDFGPPDPDNPISAPVTAAFNFASGTPTDASGNHVPITGNSGPSYLPRLSLSPNSALVPNPKDQPLATFGPTFGIMAWVKLPPISVTEGYQNVLYTVSRGAWSYPLIVQPSSDHDPSKCNILLAEGGMINVPVESYIHIAVSQYPNGDGQSQLVWVNGHKSGIGMGYPHGPTPSGPTQFGIVGNYPGVNATSAMQGISVWDRILADADVQADIAGQDPTGSDGLLGYFALQHDLRNSVTGNEATITNAQLVDVVENEVDSVKVREALTNHSPGIGDQSEQIRFFQSEDFHQIGAAHDLLIDGGLNESGLTAQHIKFLDWTENALKKARPAMDFDREAIVQDLLLGEQLCKAEIKTGQFETTRQGGHTVILFHKTSGPVEVFRTDEIIDPTTEWILTIISDVISILGGIFGLITTTSKLSTVFKIVLRVIPVIKNVLLDAFHQKDAPSAVIAVIREIWSAGLMLTVIKGLVTGSWWSLIFTALAILGQILAAAFSGGAALAIKLLTVGVLVARLLCDLNKMPEPAQ